MSRRLVLTAALFACVACGGGGARLPADGAPGEAGPLIEAFTAEPPALYPGETVLLRPVFRGGAGRIEPDVGAVASGEAVVLKPGTSPKRYRLVVERDGRAAEATLDLVVAYRHRLDSATPGLARSEHAAALLEDGRVLLAGGLSGSGFQGGTELWDPATGAFARAGDLDLPHSDAAAALDVKGVLLVTGGLDGDPADDIFSRAVHAFSPAAGAWRRLADMLEARFHHTATPLEDGRLLLAGGAFLGRAPGTVATEEIYDPAGARPRRVLGRGLSAPRYDHTATALDDGTILLAGGRDAFTDRVLPVAELYDPATEAFTPVGDMVVGRASHVAARLADGRVLLAGGDTATQLGTVSAEVYDPVRRSFTATGPLRHGRTFHAAIALATGEVLVAGGQDEAGVRLEALEVYRPSSADFTETARLAPGRTGLALVTLPDGAVLVHGGRLENGSVVGDVALYR